MRKAKCMNFSGDIVAGDDLMVKIGQKISAKNMTVYGFDIVCNKPITVLLGQDNEVMAMPYGNQFAVHLPSSEEAIGTDVFTMIVNQSCNIICMNVLYNI